MEISLEPENITVSTMEYLHKKLAFSSRWEVGKPNTNLVPHFLPEEKYEK